MQNVYFVSVGKLCAETGGRATPLASDTIETYRSTVREIGKRREWKSTGSGAQFLGVATAVQSDRDIATSVEAVACVAPDKLIFAATLEDSCGLYSKNPHNPDEPEGYIVRRQNTRIYHIDYDPVEHLLAVSASEGHLEKHLALCGEVKANFRFVTEGDSVDITPSFSLRDNRVIYFSTAGFYIDRSSRRGGVHYSAYSISRYDMRTDDIDEVTADEKYDFLLPREDRDGVLHCIRRPRKLQEEKGPTLLDVLLMPVRLLRAIFGWLNFFTQRYTGESLLKKGGSTNNPAKDRDQSDEDFFIEGNLVHAGQAQRENALKGEKYPGTAPASWELVRLGAAGAVTVLKKGVLDYSFDAQGGILYSNGKYILRIDPEGDEEVICEAKVARSPTCPVTVQNDQE